MDRKLTDRIFKVKGMSCPSCEIKIEKRLRKMEGIIGVKASSIQSQVTVNYDSAIVTANQIEAAIIELGYEVTSEGSVALGHNERKKANNQLIGIGIIIFALYLIIKSTIGFNFIPQIEQSVGYGMLFVIGLLTSLHCIAMCGGINLSQAVIAYQPSNNESKFAKFKPSILYNTGRVISYTIMGGIVGLVGSVIGFSGTTKGIVAIVGGIFMVVIGINTLDIFPWLRKIRIGFPKFFGDKIYSNNKGGPFYIGLLNGLMPCGPLQTMQLYALGTGSFWTGAFAMFLFSLGTVPLMFGFGAISSLLGSKFTHRMLKVSAVLVIVLGLTMVSRGVSLSGVSLAAPNVNSATATSNVAKVNGNVQEVTTIFTNGQYQPFVVQKGIPVKWIIKVTDADLNGCNNPVTIPKYNISKKLVPGDNVIEFTPRKEGTVTYTCWMGMISSSFKVVTDVAKLSQSDLKKVSQAAQSDNVGGGGGYCTVSAKATRLQGGRIPAGDIQVAKVVDGVQEVTIKVNAQGYSPAAIIMRRGVKAKIKFDPEQVNSCNYAVVFPEYQGQLDLRRGQTETPELTVTRDFTFQCWMGMLHGYVKVVDDVNNINLEAAKTEIEAYKPAGGGGCCGG